VADRLRGAGQAPSDDALGVGLRAAAADLGEDVDPVLVCEFVQPQGAAAGAAVAARQHGPEGIEQFCRHLLDDHGVALIPGSAFGAPGHFRLSFAAAIPVLTEALDELSAAGKGLR
jgi:hypothetical protein